MADSDVPDDWENDQYDMEEPDKENYPEPEGNADGFVVDDDMAIEPVTHSSGDIELAFSLLEAVLDVHANQSPASKLFRVNDAYKKHLAAIVLQLGESCNVFMDGENYLATMRPTFKHAVEFCKQFGQAFAIISKNTWHPHRQYSLVQESDRSRIVDVCHNPNSKSGSWLSCDKEIDDIVLISCALYRLKQYPGEEVVVLTNDNYRFLDCSYLCKTFSSVSRKGYTLVRGSQATRRMDFCTTQNCSPRQYGAGTRTGYLELIALFAVTVAMSFATV